MELGVLAVGLAMDATAAAAGIGASGGRLRPVIVAALLFGLFQAGMSAIGWWAGTALAEVAARWDHWIAFVLLVGIGVRTIRGAWSESDDAPPASHGLAVLVTLAVATSIDALAAGVTLPTLGVDGWIAVVAIGVVTTILSLAGGSVGRALGDRFGATLAGAGGVVLIGLGTKILVEHLSRGT